MLLEHPEAVQEFFALDSNADRRLDLVLPTSQSNPKKYANLVGEL